MMARPAPSRSRASTTARPTCSSSATPASPIAQPEPRPSSPTTGSINSDCLSRASTASGSPQGQATVGLTRRYSANSRPASEHAAMYPAATGSHPPTPKRPGRRSPSPCPRRRLSGSSWPPTEQPTPSAGSASTTGTPSPAPTRPGCPPFLSTAANGRRTQTPTAANTRAPNGTTTRPSQSSASVDLTQRPVRQNRSRAHDGSTRWRRWARWVSVTYRSCATDSGMSTFRGGGQFVSRRAFRSPLLVSAGWG
jgi:hypothetical protein